MTVSIIMPAFQAEQTIVAAIDSVLSQTYDDWELVVVDDGSTDRTAELVEAFSDPRIRLLRMEHAGVLGAVRNRGIAAASGDLIALLDADDLWHPEKLRRQLSVIESRPEVGVVHTGYTFLKDGVESVAPRPNFTDATFVDLLHENSICGSSALIRRGLLERHGTYDERPELRGSPDYELWLRLALVTQFAHVPEPLYVYRIHSDQMSARPRWMNAGALVALECIRQHSPDAVSRHEALYQRTVGILRCSERMPGRGRVNLVRALWRRPTDRLAWSWLARSVIGEESVRRLGRVLRRRRAGPAPA